MPEPKVKPATQKNSNRNGRQPTPSEKYIQDSMNKINKAQIELAEMKMKLCDRRMKTKCSVFDTVECGETCKLTKKAYKRKYNEMKQLKRRVDLRIAQDKQEQMSKVKKAEELFELITQVIGPNEDVYKTLNRSFLPQKKQKIAYGRNQDRFKELCLLSFKGHS